MKVSVLLHTTEYRGEYTAAVVEAYEPNTCETVKDLAERLLLTKEGRDSYANPHRDWIELRLVKESV